MRESTLEQLKYPIGHFVKPAEITRLVKTDWMAEIEAVPVKLSDLVKGLSKEQLDTPYRPNGWTIRQVVHHLADSHQNSYIRFKWALTEDQPVIKPYDEKAWAGLRDSLSGPIALSLDHLKAIHAKLIYLFKGLTEEEFGKSFIHPVGNIVSTIEENIGRYAWHGNHHCTHIENLLYREGWIK